MKSAATQQLERRLPRTAPLLVAVTLALLLLNLLAWQVGERIFLDEARRMDRERNSLQVARVGKLLQREARSLKRIVLSRADRLARDAAVRRSGLATVDFTQSVSETFLAGTNIDAYLVADRARAILFACRRNPASDALEAMTSPERALLVALPLRVKAGDGGFYGLVAAGAGTVAMVAGVPVGPYGWLIARRDLNDTQVEKYGDLVEAPFKIRSLAPGAATNVGGGEAFIVSASGELRWQLDDLEGRPTLQLRMAYDRAYEEHMSGVVASSRGVILLFSSLAGVLALLLFWRWREALWREAQTQLDAERVARLAAVGELAAGVAHEINNPNGMIRRNLDFVRDVLHDALPLLAERDDAGELTVGGLDFAAAREQLPRLLDDMTRGARQIGEIVRELKDFARDDASEFDGGCEPNEAVEAAVRLLDGAIRKATDRFTLELSAGLPRVRGNLRQIEQVVLNLVQNACQALPDRERGIAVATRCDSVARCVYIEIDDEGTGIAPEHLERIFEPFFTTRRENGGTGLGLSVSLRIVKRHGGQLKFDSHPGLGTRATVILPLAEERS